MPPPPRAGSGDEIGTHWVHGLISISSPPDAPERGNTLSIREEPNEIGPYFVPGQYAVGGGPMIAGSKLAIVVLTAPMLSGGALVALTHGTEASGGPDR